MATAVSQNNNIEISQEMTEIIRRIQVGLVESSYPCRASLCQKCRFQNFVLFHLLLYLQDSQNVIGVMVLNNEGFPVKSNLDNTTTVQVT